MSEFGGSASRSSSPETTEWNEDRAYQERLEAMANRSDSYDPFEASFETYEENERAGDSEPAARPDRPVRLDPSRSVAEQMSASLDSNETIDDALPRMVAREQITSGTEHRIAIGEDIQASIYLGNAEMATNSESEADDPRRISIIDLRSAPRGADGTIQYEGHRLNADLQYLLVQGAPNWEEDTGYKGIRAGETVNIGRADDATSRRFELPDSVSREHCTISIDEETGELIVTDKESTNGTTIEMSSEALSTESREAAIAARDAAVEASEQTRPAVEAGPQLEIEEIARAHELLANSTLLRTDIKDIATEAVSAAQRGTAHTLNAISTPKNKYLEWRRDAAQEKYDRKAARQGTSMFKFINKHYDKAAAKAQGKLNDRQSRYSKHSAMMDGRVTNTEQRTVERRELGEKLRTKLMEDKIKAEERKLIRKEKAERRRQLKQSTDRLSYQERQRIIDEFTPEHRRRIRNTAIRAIKNKRT